MVVVALVAGLASVAKAPPVAAGTPPAAAAPVAASADGGAGSRLTGRGEILTYLFTRRATRGTAPRPPAPCRWTTLDDDDLEWLVELTVLAVRLGIDSPLFDTLGPHLGGERLQGDYQLRVCDGRLVESRFVPRDGELPTNEILLRRMITRVPLPDPQVSPPVGAPVPVGQPVFVSIPPLQWRPIEGVLEHEGRVATVRAEPIAMRVVSGDPASDAVVCSGPGRPFDPSLALSPARQARDPLACTVTYRTANRRPDPDGPHPGWVFRELAERPPSWIGAVTVLWQARWRVDDGPWQALGTIQRTRLTERTVREVHTTIRSGR